MWAPGKGYHQRYRTEALSEMFVGVGATVELYYTATADGDGYVTQDLTAAVGGGNVEERVLYYKAGAFGDSGTTVGYTNAGLATDATYTEMLTAFNNLLKTEGAPITVYATRTEVSGRTGLLDTYGGAAAAYSLRLLEGSYTGAAIRVRRDSDDAEQDIGFDGNGDLDTTALAGFCSGTDGFVKVWYCQSGNGNDATQTTTTLQPKIYDSSTGVVTENGNPAINNNSGYLSLTSAITTVAHSVFITGAWADGAIAAQSDAASYVGYAVLGSLITRNSSSQQYRWPFTDFNTQKLHTQISSAAYDVDGFLNEVELTPTVTNISSGNWIFNRLFSASISQSFTTNEIIIYDSDQSSNRTGIETNINDHYNIYTPFTTGLLDDYSGAAAAYSLRRLSSTYTGPAIRVRRASDNAEQDINFDIEGNLNTGALATFCSGTDGFVKVWYDQSSNGNDATQTTTGNQPKIYDSSTGVQTENGKPAIYFDGADDTFTFTEVSNITTLLLIAAPDDTTGNGSCFILGDNNTFNYHSGDLGVWLHPTFSAASVRNGNNYLNGTLTNLTTTTRTTAQVSLAMFHDGTATGSQLFRDRAGTKHWTGTAQEFVIYPSDQSANRTGIETNINDYYSIYTP